MIKIPDFARYLPFSPHTVDWGVAVSAGGRQKIGAAEAYPPAGHPADHRFSWQDGRRLGATQLVFVRQGRGWFEARQGGLRPIAAGEVMVLPPQLWHRYRPDQATGWEEWWIELEGPVVRRLETELMLGNGTRVIRPTARVPLEALWASLLQRLLADDASSHDPVRGAMGLQILAMLLGGRSMLERDGERSLWVRRAERRLAENLREPPSAEELAQECGVSATQFRREFRRVTGMPPHRYLSRLRLTQARRVLGSGRIKLDDLAERLGYSSAYHLSAAFKKEFGISPRDWRRTEQD